MVGSGGDEGMELLASLLVPYLLAAPMVWNPSEPIPDRQIVMFVTWGLGTCVYGGGAGLLYASAVSSFDALTDRTQRLSQYTAPHRREVRPTSDGEMVVEAP
jgi:hypothetical protein